MPKSHRPYPAAFRRQTFGPRWVASARLRQRDVREFLRDA